MKTATKVSLGLSIAAVAGITTAVMVSDKVWKKCKQRSNHRKVEGYVVDHLNGNKTLLDSVDRLEAKKIENLLAMANKVTDDCDKIVQFEKKVTSKRNRIKHS